jgi:hypothetical protein
MTSKLTTVVITALALGGTAFGQTPRVMRYSGVLHDAAGAVRSGPATLSFTISADPEGHVALWTETQVVTADRVGRYAVLLGATTPEGLPADLFAHGDARWLGVSVDGGPEAPRVALVSVPYALKAADADTVGGKPLSAFLLAGEKTEIRDDGLTYIDKRVIDQALSGAFDAEPLTIGNPGYIGVFTSTTDLGNSVMFQSANRIGVGTTAPAAPLNVSASSAPAVFFDVISNSLGALPAIYRAARGTPGFPTAVQAHDILGGLAVRGHTGAGFSEGKGQVMFKAAENWTPAANGTYLQFTTTPTGSTVFSERMRIDPSGYVGIGTSTPSFRLDVIGAAADPVAIAGWSTYGGGTGTGIYGEGSGTNSGVEGWGDTGFGVLGASSYVGVLGYADPATGWAGVFDGDVDVSGILTKGGGAFRIDHPLDPENKYLSHSFLESPDMKNLYDGVVMLDERGEATVALPDWFEALNQDFRYQLTPIGAAFVPFVAAEIAGNQFKIGGGVAGAKVSWQVTGIRHDPFAAANRIQVEEDKPEAAAGTYLHPAAYGKLTQTTTTKWTSKDAASAQRARDLKARIRTARQKGSDK